MTEDDPREREGGTVEGTVLEQLPHGLYRVGIERQRQVTAHVPSGPGRNFIRVIVAVGEIGYDSSCRRGI